MWQCLCDTAPKLHAPPENKNDESENNRREKHTHFISCQQIAGKYRNINIANKFFENVAKFNYLERK